VIKARNIYINALVRFIDRLTNHKLESVILFGSYVRGECAKNSDLDILFVLSDDVAERVLRLIKKIFFILSLKERNNNVSVLDKILLAIESETGMFVSGFVSRLSELLNMNFSKVFNTNPILSKLLATTRIIFANLMKNYKVLFGKNVLQMLSKQIIEPVPLEVVKSLIMNVILSLGAFFIAFKKDTIKYSLEAVKWSLMAFCYSLKIPPSIYKAVKILLSFGLKTLQQIFLPSRIYGKYNPILFVLSPYLVLRIHLLSLKIGKFARNKR